MVYFLVLQPLWSALIQAVVGECSAPKPGMIDFVGKAKWEAWTSLKGLTKVSLPFCHIFSHASALSFYSYANHFSCLVRRM